MTRRDFSLLLTSSLARAESASGEVIETMLAQSTPENRRNSEGDVIALKDGTLLAAWSDFYGGSSDEAPARISAAISRDGGRAWSPRHTLLENTGKQNVMSVSFLRSRSGEVLFFYLVKNSGTELYPEVRRSRDEGKTWSAAVRVVTDPGYYVMNNARVVRLKSGRILCPASFVEDLGSHGQNFRTVMYCSDDDGRTWRRGKQTVSCPKRGAMEPGLLEMNDGRLLQIIRTQLGRIWYSYSTDGGDSWTEAQPWTMAAPEAPATLVRLPGKGELLLIYNPVVNLAAGHSGPRTPLVAATSADEGRTWSQPMTLEGDPSATYAYTSATIHRSRVLLTYYVERGGLLSLKFKSIPIEWLRAAGVTSR